MGRPTHEVAMPGAALAPRSAKERRTDVRVPAPRSQGNLGHDGDQSEDLMRQVISDRLATSSAKDSSANQSRSATRASRSERRRTKGGTPSSPKRGNKNDSTNSSRRPASEDFNDDGFGEEENNARHSYATHDYEVAAVRPGPIRVPGIDSQGQIVEEVDDMSYMGSVHSVASSPNKPRSKHKGISRPNKRASNLVHAQAIDEDDEELGENEKRVIEEQARRDIEARIIKAEEVDPTTVEGKARRRRNIYILAIVVVLVAVGAVIATVLALGNSESDEEVAPSQSPTVKPTLFSGASVCEDAVDMTSQIGSSIAGTVPEDAILAPVDTCDVIFRNGAGVWYQLQGDGSRMEISTCGEGTSFDTQLSVFTGSCSNLLCIAGNDQMEGCGDQSQLAIDTTKGATYFVYVHGRRNAFGLFNLTLDVLENNDRCTNSTLIDFEATETQQTARLFGSTKGTTLESAACEGVSFDGPGVWYEVPGTGTDITAELTSSRATSFKGRIAYFEGNECDSLICLPGRSIQSEVGKLYYILVYGIELEEEGDFELLVNSEELSGGLPFPKLPIPCEFSEILRPGQSSVGETLGDALDVVSCGNEVFATSAGTWYLTTGTGSILTVSTCADSPSSFDTQISVYKGTCGDFQCIDGNDQACGDQSQVSFLSEADESYVILVHGYGNDIGPFSISLTEERSTEISLQCDTAISLLPDGQTLLGAFDSFVTNSNPEEIPTCGAVQEEITSIWYKVVGTGTTLSLSTCFSQYDLTTAVSVLSGDCGDGTLECVSTGQYIPCGEQFSYVWMAEEGVEYHVVLHVGQTTSVSSTAKAFAFALEEAPPNKDCETAIGPLNPAEGSTIFGSTRGASVSEEGDIDNESRSVWYKAVGVGSSIVASTCSIGTDFVTSLSVYRGSCDENALESASQAQLTVAGSCGTDFGSVLEWFGEEGVTYYILVAGSSVDEFGNYILTLSEGATASS